MVHDIDLSTERAAFAYTGARPWHKLGTEVEGAMTSKEALMLGGLDWEVSKRPLFTTEHDGNLAMPSKRLGRHFATVRQDTNAILGVVGTGYQIVQNSDALSFFDGALGEGAAAIETVGALSRGRKVFMLARMPELVEIVEGDPYEQFLLFSNGHDGLTSVTVAFTPIRVVCNNTLAVALKNAQRSIKIRHTSNAKDQLKIAHEVLAANELYWSKIRAALTFMKNRDVKRDQVKDFVANLFPGRVDAKTKERSVSTRTKKRRQAVERAFEESPGAELAGNTAYGLFQAATYWLDHRRPLPKGSDRWESSIVGSGVKIRQRAFELALAI